LTYLLDTHLVLWALTSSKRLSAEVRMLIEDERNELVFSVTSIWEVAIKRDLDRPGFQVEPAVLRQHLLNDGYRELALTSQHAIALRGMAKIHRDPFDRILVAQAIVEGLTLLTVDAEMAKYPGPIRLV
jgi:PIN domain nuclease of toxin-antitoxin system